MPDEIETLTARARQLEQDNALLRLARRRMLGRAGSAGTAGLHSAAAQQGLLQIVHDFCDHTNAICADCQFPELVRSFENAVKPTI